MPTGTQKLRPAGSWTRPVCLTLLLLGTTLLAQLLSAPRARAHDIHADCRVGRSWMGVGPHYHPGGYGRAVRCSRNPRQRGDPEQTPSPPTPSGRKYYEIEPQRGGQR